MNAAGVARGYASAIGSDDRTGTVSFLTRCLRERNPHGLVRAALLKTLWA